MPETQEADSNQDKASNKKKRRPRVWLWFVLYGVLVLAGLSIGSLYFKNGADRAKFWVEGLLSAAVLSVVAIQAYIYQKQWHVMERQWKEANRQAESSAQLIELMVANERAYMRVGSWKPPRICENGRLHVEARLRNGGRTPAWGVATGSKPIRIGLRQPQPLPPVPSGEEHWREYGAVDSTEPMKITFDPIEVTDEEAEALKGGKMNIFIDGVCCYFDSLGGKQYYTYGFTLNFKRGVVPRYERHHRLEVNRENPTENRET